MRQMYSIKFANFLVYEYFIFSLFCVCVDMRSNHRIAYLINARRRLYYNKNACELCLPPNVVAQAYFVQEYMLPEVIISLCVSFILVRAERLTMCA